MGFNSGFKGLNKITEFVFFVLFNLKRKVNALGAIFIVCNAS